MGFFVGNRDTVTGEEVMGESVRAMEGMEVVGFADGDSGVLDGV